MGGCPAVTAGLLDSRGLWGPYRAQGKDPGVFTGSDWTGAETELQHHVPDWTGPALILIIKGTIFCKHYLLKQW